MAGIKLDMDHPITLTHSFKAPRADVFHAWADDTLVKKWWGPKNFTCLFFKADFKVGGRYLGCMTSKEYGDMWSTGIYKEITKPELIVYTDAFSDEKGRITPGDAIEMPGQWPDECLARVTFEEKAAKTLLTLKHCGIAKESQADCIGGWTETLGKLERLFL